MAKIHRSRNNLKKKFNINCHYDLFWMAQILRSRNNSKINLIGKNLVTKANLEWIIFRWCNASKINSLNKLFIVATTMSSGSNSQMTYFFFFVVQVYLLLHFSVYKTLFTYFPPLSLISYSTIKLFLVIEKSYICLL